jgi:hypothetical protein
MQKYGLCMDNSLDVIKPDGMKYTRMDAKTSVSLPTGTAHIDDKRYSIAVSFIISQ